MLYACGLAAKVAEKNACDSFSKLNYASLNWPMRIVLKRKIAILKIKITILRIKIVISKV